MYKESGPVIETPLSAAQSMHDMVCQSWGGTVRMFPAVPSGWPDIALHNFRTQGAFLLGASRKAGTTQWVRVRSEAGAPLRLRTGITGPLAVRGCDGREPRWYQLSNGDIAVDLRPGQEALVYPAGTRPDVTIAPVAGAPSIPWGLS